MASPAAEGSATNMSESRTEALQALLDSLAPGADASTEGSLNTSQVRKLSDKLGELLGEDAMPDVSQRNAKGELVNEEGLPIIDIVEPLPTSDSQSPSTVAASAPAVHDPDLIPLWALGPAEKARRRAERDRILDMLENEERTQREKDEEEERERFKAELEKRKQAADADMDALKKAREMQKKMGKALLRNLAEARDREAEEKRALEEAEKQAREERKKLKPKKSVTFADLPPDHEHQPANSVPMPPPFDWGDITPARIQTGSTGSLLTKSQMDKGPMRMNVIERVPGSGKGPKSPPPPSQKDSDDESEPEADSDEGDIVLDLSDDEGAAPSDSHDDSDSDYGVTEDNEPVEWDDEGYDFARHQREIALAYYEKRATVGAEALAAMRNHDHAEEEHEWNQPVVPLEASLASSPPKPSMSRFKAERSSSLPSQSLGASILPASQTSTLKDAVRLGKLEDGNLVGGQQGESEDELEPAARDMLEMLKKGDVMNVGPTLPSASQDPYGVSQNSTIPATNETAAPTTSASHEPTLAAPKARLSKVSQFKMSFSQSSAISSPASSTGSSLPTPTTTTQRSSPKSISPMGVPIPVPTKTFHVAGPSQIAPTTTRPAQMPGMIVDSPSFPVPGAAASPYSPGLTNSRSSSSTAFQSVIIESPSFHSPSSTLVGTPGQSPLPSLGIPSPITPTATTPVSASVLERRPVIVTQVRESNPAVSRSAESTPVEKKKVSRFLAERM